LNNFNFVSLIIKIYTEEGFVYRRINKILRDHDTELFLNLRYYYFSLIYSLKKCNLDFQKKVLYRGMKLRNQELITFYENLDLSQMMQFHEFLSTTYDINIAKKYADKGVGSYLLEINIPNEVIVSSIENYSRFQHEREVLLPSGSILQFQGKKTEDELTTLSLNLIISNMDAFSNLLSRFKTDVDLSKIDFNLIELQNFFKILNNQKSITRITLKVFNHLLIPYYAEYISTNKKLCETKLIREGDIVSHRIIHHVLSRHSTTHLRNFSREETKLFLQHFLRNINEFISLSLIDFEQVFLNIMNSEEYDLQLEKLIIKNNRKVENETISCLSFISKSKRLTNTLIELNLIGYALIGGAIYQICHFLKHSPSIKKANLTLENCEQIQNISQIFETNQSLKEFHVTFRSDLNNTRKITFITEKLQMKKIFFYNILNSNFIIFINDLITHYKDMKYLDLSQNQLNNNLFQETFIHIISYMSSLENLDLSFNHLCDNFIQNVYNHVKNSVFLHTLNL
jgi:hypothetical protein